MCCPIRTVIIVVIDKSDSCCTVVQFYYHLYDYGWNWTPFSPITITYGKTVIHLVLHYYWLPVFWTVYFPFFHRKLGLDWKGPWGVFHYFDLILHLMFNPVTPITNQDRISPYNSNTISSRQVMRIKKDIN